ncbi:DUF1501 domain-containing protein [Ideonella sp. BN130291]|uniref:DUF1501 domain-containing protein n=1 Tax=Ideonella sp. BN130291 TaxID=3112940 RepID=UPI002E265B6B|nr:DUF1501 domain-containing protein [Ideonella sp. BN130291]
MQRRQWLQLGIAGAAASLLTPSTRLWAAAPGTSGPRLLVVFLRGGYDAANLLVPHGSPFYYEARPNIAIARPGSAPEAALPIDAQWGLAPALAGNVATLFSSGQATFVPFAGTDDTSRSHFETQDRIELGNAPDSGAAGRASGFLNRLAGVLDAQPGSAMASLAFTEQVPLVFRGPQPVANQSLRAIGKAGIAPRQAALIERMYADTALAGTVSSGFEVRHEVAREMAGEMEAANRNAIGSKGFEAEARRIGRLMRESVQLGFVDVGGWDTHVGEGGATGALASRLGELGRGLAALADALGPAWQRTVVVVLSEFGRTFRENGNRGTDHGHGSVYWVLGGAVRGGVRGEQQALSAATLFQNRDYPVLNEYRALLGGLFQRMYGLNAAQLERVFPGTRPSDIGLL